MSALAIGAIVWSARRAATRSVGPTEERLFRAVNGLPEAVRPVAAPIMQMGSLAAVWVTAEGVRRRRGAADALVVAALGTSVGGGIKLIKPRVGRGRPAAHLDRGAVRGQAQSGLGSPSGHAAVSLTLALVAVRSPRARSAALVAAAVTGLSRVYVGAHLPLDIVGGYAVGLLVGVHDWSSAAGALERAAGPLRTRASAR
jgi:membrane-associated phospholipid phosphatase